MPMTKPTSEQVTFLPAGAGAVQRNLVDKVRESISLADFGVVADGVTDDTLAFAAAIAAQQASGKTLVGIAGGNANLASWSRVTTSSPFYFDGNHMTVTCGNPTSVEFIDCQNDFDIRNTDFQQWFRVLDCQPTTNRITLGVFADNTTYGRRKIDPATGNTISNFAWQVAIRCYFDDIIIDNNTIENASVYGIVTGTQDAGFNDDVMYRRVLISRNRIINVNAGGGGPGSVYATIQQGHSVKWIGNYIENVNGSSVALGGSYGNGAFALYCKCRYAIASGNYLKNIGNDTGVLFTTEAHAINTKGARGVVENNILDTIGKEAPAISQGAIANDKNDGYVCRNNIVRNCGHALALGNNDIVEGNYIQLGNRNAAYPGVIGVGPSQSDEYCIASNNYVTALPGHSATISAVIRADPYVLPDGGRTLICGNRIVNVPATAIASVFGVNQAPIRGLQIVNNYIQDCGAGILISATNANGANDVVVQSNIIKSTPNPVSTSAVGGIFVRDNTGSVTRNAGKATAISSGNTVTHGLVSTPELVFVTPMSSGVTDVTVTNLTSTTFVINFGGGGTKDFAWDAQTTRYNGRF